MAKIPLSEETMFCLSSVDGHLGYHAQCCYQRMFGHRFLYSIAYYSSFKDLSLHSNIPRPFMAQSLPVSLDSSAITILPHSLSCNLHSLLSVSWIPHAPFSHRAFAHVAPSDCNAFCIPSSPLCSNIHIPSSGRCSQAVPRTHTSFLVPCTFYSECPYINSSIHPFNKHLLNTS